MADQTATFAIQLEDETSDAAVSASNALEDLRKTIKGDQAELAAMQKAMKNLQGGTQVNIAQFRQLKAGIEAKRVAVASATSSYIGLGGSLAQMTPKVESFKKRVAELTKEVVAVQAPVKELIPKVLTFRDRFEALTKQTTALQGPLGPVVKRFEQLSKLVGGGGMAMGIVAIGVAMAALVVATGLAVVALFKYGVAQADARRSELLRLEGLAKLAAGNKAVVGSASGVQQSIDRVAASSSLGREKIVEYANQLTALGMTGTQHAATLEAMAIKATTQGEAQAAAHAKLAAGMDQAGGAVERLADKVRGELGGIAAAQLLGFSVQVAKLRESFDALFGDLKIGGFLKNMRSVTELFSQSTASGRALKQLVGIMLSPLINQVGTVGPVVQEFFLGMVLGAQSVVIALLQVRNWFKRTFGGPEVANIEKSTAAVTAGKVAIVAFGVGLAAASVLATGLAIKLTMLLVPALWKMSLALGSIAVRALVIAWPFVVAAAAVWGLIKIFELLYVVWREVDWKDLGRSIWKGLVEGLGGGLHKLVEKAQQLASATWKAFKDKLGISSPSRVFAELGLAIPQGVIAGVDAGKGEAQQAVASVVTAPTAPSVPVPRSSTAEADAVAAAGVGGTTNTLTIGELHVHSSSDKAAELAGDVKRELERILEGVLLQMGGATS